MLEVRQEQLKLMQTALLSGNEPDDTLPNALFVWGPAQTGKGRVVEEAVFRSGIRHFARVNALETLCGRRPFLQTILEQLFRSELSNGGMSKDAVTCEDFNSFVQRLRSNTKETDDTMVVLIDRAERLVRDNSDLLYVLVNCQELSGRKICVILNSSLPLVSFCNVPQMRQITTFHFPQFLKSELYSILKSDPPADLPDMEMYDFFVKTLLDVHYNRCRDLKKLRRMAHQHLAETMEKRPTGNEPDVMALWKNIKNMKVEFKPLGTPATDKSCLKNNENALSQMPHYSKYMLIAAFLASQNPPSSDRRFFVKGRGARKRHNVTTPSVQSSSKLRQSLMFSHARLLAIFTVLVGNKCPVDVPLMSLITTLCNSKLLTRFDDSLDDCKYRCLASLDFVTSIGNSIDFDVKQYVFHLV